MAIPVVQWVILNFCYTLRRAVLLKRAWITKDACHPEITWHFAGEKCCFGGFFLRRVLKGKKKTTKNETV